MRIFLARKSILVFTLVCLFIPLHTQAKNPENNNRQSLSKPSEKDIKLIKAGKMLDVTNGDIVENVTILIEGNKIKEINPKNIPKNAQIIDLGKQTILPGLTDMHVHLTTNLEKNFKLDLTRKDPTLQALNAAHNAKLTLDAGYTTVRDLGVFIGTNDSFSANNSVSTAISQNLIPGPKVISAGHFLSITGGHGDITGFAPGVRELDYKQGIVDGVDEAIKAVRYQIKYGAKVIKFMATGGVITEEGGIPLSPQFSLQEMQAICDTSHRVGIKCAAHAEGLQGILMALKAGVDTIEHGFELSDEAIEIMKKNGVFLIPTMMAVNFSELYIPFNTMPKNIQEKGMGLKHKAIISFKKALKAGVKIASGSDAGVCRHGKNATELVLYVKNGMTPLQAIQTATINAADALGSYALSNQKIGDIKPGYQANIIAVSGNPLENIKELTNVNFVMKNGVIHKNASST
jgi:imidazolonepropionase-like amidohydrolase